MQTPPTVLLPVEVALAMRFDAAPDDALLPPEVVSAATGISLGTLANYRVNHPRLLPFEKHGRFIWYPAHGVRRFMQSSAIAPKTEDASWHTNQLRLPERQES